MAAAVAQQCSMGVRCPPLSASSQSIGKPAGAAAVSLGQLGLQRWGWCGGGGRSSNTSVVAQAVNLNTNALQSREKQQLKEQFEEAYERCRTAPMESVGFTVEDFLSALEKYDFDSEVGTRRRPLFLFPPPPPLPGQEGGTVAAAMAHQLVRRPSPLLPCSPPVKVSSSSSKVPPFLLHGACRGSSTVGSAAATLVVHAVNLNTNALQSRERRRLKDQFYEASERCLDAPLEGVLFTEEEFLGALEKYELKSEVGIKVKGTVFMTDTNGALVDITAKSSAYLPVQEACIYRVKHVSEVGIFPGFQEEFVVIGEKEADDSLVLSLRSIQYDLAWERCRQLQAEDVVVKGKIIGGNKGGVVAIVEGLRGFVPFSQISTKSTAEELITRELPLKFVEVDEEQSRLVLSNRKAMADSQAQLGIGSVVLGTVQSLKPYGAFIDIGGLTGLLHVSQISHDRVSDVSTVLQPGDALKVMILSHDRERGRVSLSTKKLEPTPGDMIRNPKLVFEKADEMAQAFRQRIAQAEAMARADMLRFQPGESGLSLSSDGILGPLTSDLPAEGLDMSDIPLAEEV
ncbi:hypothetical protein Taro_033249 [Colocasia esculenta]|uniref:Small ribosomal subunit protein bS1c n=1 Tax=Colocasia esculenta TaxID=4460 RepID=A0A843VTD8_COLES|nr:hypothetical protein [Colocasia esculenta]